MAEKYNIFEQAIKSFLKDKNFRKKGRTWYRDYEDVVFVINLQKSSWGNQFYLNAAISIKSLIAEEFPKEHLCQIRFSLPGSFSKTNAAEFALVLDLENESYPDHKRSEIVQYEIQTTLDFVEKNLSSQKLVIEGFRNKILSNCLYHKDLNEIIG